MIIQAYQPFDIGDGSVMTYDGAVDAFAIGKRTTIRFPHDAPPREGVIVASLADDYGVKYSIELPDEDDAPPLKDDVAMEINGVPLLAVTRFSVTGDLNNSCLVSVDFYGEIDLEGERIVKVTNVQPSEIEDGNIEVAE